MIGIIILIIAIVQYRKLATAKGESKKAYTILTFGVFILSMIAWWILEWTLGLQMFLGRYIGAILHYVVVPAAALWYVHKLLKEGASLSDYISTNGEDRSTGNHRDIEL